MSLLAAAALMTGTLVAGTPVAVDAELLAGLPEASAAFTAHDVHHVCQGPKLSAVLARLGVPTGEAVRGKVLAQGVVLRARDGYAVLFSLGEVDPGLGNEAAIIATRCDGTAIAAQDGPYRVVVPGDGRPARSLRQLATIELR